MACFIRGFMAKNAPHKNAPNSKSATLSGRGELLLTQNMCKQIF